MAWKITQVFLGSDQQTLIKFVTCRFRSTLTVTTVQGWVHCNSRHKRRHLSASKATLKIIKCDTLCTWRAQLRQSLTTSAPFPALSMFSTRALESTRSTLTSAQCNQQNFSCALSLHTQKGSLLPSLLLSLELS